MLVVLGATGRTGRVVSALLRERSTQPVRVVTRQAARWARLQQHAAGHFEVAEAQLDDEAQLARAARGAHALFVVLPDDLGALTFHAGRLAMANAIARAVAQTLVPRVVLLSSSTAALGEHAGNGFGSGLAYLERILGETRAVLTVLRAGWFQDNLVAALPFAARDGVHASLLRTGEAPIATVASCDVAAIAARTLLAPAPHRSEIVDVVGPAYTVEEMAGALGDAVQKPVSVLDLPRASREQMLRAWMSPEAAATMIQTCDCLASGRVELRGDRIEHAFTTLSTVLRRAAAEGDAQFARDKEAAA